MYEAGDGAEDDTALALVGEVITRWLEVARMAWNVPANLPYQAGSTFLVMLLSKYSEYSYRECDD